MNGYSFIEVLVSIAILLVAIVGPMTIAADGIKNARLAQEQTIATFLAQEGIEVAFRLRTNQSLRHLEDGSDPWQWFEDIKTLFPECVGVAPEAQCRISGQLSQYESCDHTTCRVHQRESGVLRYNQEMIGEPTPYSRFITFREVDSGEVEVHSVVEWESSAVTGTQRVDLVTHIHDIHGTN